MKNQDDLDRFYHLIAQVEKVSNEALQYISESKLSSDKKDFYKKSLNEVLKLNKEIEEIGGVLAEEKIDLAAH